MLETVKGNGSELIIRRKKTQFGNGMFVEEGMNEGDCL
jgi:hypothetical protein